MRIENWSEMIAHDREKLQSKTYRQMFAYSIFPLLTLPLLIENEANQKLNKLEQQLFPIKA
jgi:hypothetical protein